MAKNTAEAKWTGTIGDGEGKVKLGGGAFEGDYTFKSRFEESEETELTNPEELIAAAHAACFSMAVAAGLNEADIEPDSIETTAQVTMKMIDGTPTIAKIVLTTTVEADGDEDKIREVAEGAKEQCPVSRALAGVDEVELDLTVNG